MRDGGESGNVRAAESEPSLGRAVRLAHGVGERQSTICRPRIQVKCAELPVTSSLPASRAVAAMFKSASSREWPCVCASGRISGRCRSAGHEGTVRRSGIGCNACQGAGGDHSNGCGSGSRRHDDRGRARGGGKDICGKDCRNKNGGRGRDSRWPGRLPGCRRASGSRKRYCGDADSPLTDRGRQSTITV